MGAGSRSQPTAKPSFVIIGEIKTKYDGGRPYRFCERCRNSMAGKIVGQAAAIIKSAVFGMPQSRRNRDTRSHLMPCGL